MMKSPWSEIKKPMIGTQVIINPNIFPKYAGIQYRVHSHQVKNVTVEPVNGIGKKVRIRPGYLLPNDGAQIVGAPMVTDVPMYEPLNIGSIVKVEGPGFKDSHKLFVVLADNTYKNNSVKLGFLGGETSKYYPSVPRSFITKLSLTEATTWMRTQGALTN